MDRSRLCSCLLEGVDSHQAIEKRVARPEQSCIAQQESRHCAGSRIEREDGVAGRFFEYEALK